MNYYRNKEENVKTWQERQEAAQESWEDMRPALFKECLKCHALPHNGVCMYLKSS